MPEEIKELLVTFSEMTQFAQSLQEQSEEIWNSSMEPGKWTIKDIVCHIMLWDKYFYDEAINKIASSKPVTLKHINFDEFNKGAVAYAKTISIEELIEKTIFYREKIISDIQAMPADMIVQNYIDGDGNNFNVIQYVKDFIWHDRHHMIPLQEYLKANKQ